MTTTEIAATAPDLAAVKRRQRQVWGSGDYATVAARIVLLAERLADAADLGAGTTVLDVATGTGNAALAAARSGCTVTGIDYVPALLDRGRVRAEAEGLAVEFLEADAEDLPFADAAFDAVLSCVGVMFAPDQERAAAELLRVCRPGGTLALANWTPDGFVGELLRTVGRHVPAPAGVRPPTGWGAPDRLRELLGGGVRELVVRPRTFVFRFRTPADLVDFFRTHYGPVRQALAGLDPDGARRLHADLVALAASADRASGGAPTAVPADYLEVVAVRA